MPDIDELPVTRVDDSVRVPVQPLELERLRSQHLRVSNAELRVELAGERLRSARSVFSQLVEEAMPSGQMTVDVGELVRFDIGSTNTDHFRVRSGSPAAIIFDLSGTTAVASFHDRSNSARVTVNPDNGSNDAVVTVGDGSEDVRGVVYIRRRAAVTPEAAILRMEAEDGTSRWLSWWQSTPGFYDLVASPTDPGGGPPPTGSQVIATV